MLDKKQIWIIFLFTFTTSCNAVETAHIIIIAFGPETADEGIVQGWDKKLCKGTRALKIRGAVAGHWKLTRPTERIIKADSFTTTQDVVEELSVNHSTVIQNLKQIGKVKNLDKWVPHLLTRNFKNCPFEVLSSLLLLNNSKPFLNWIMTCDEKWFCTTAANSHLSGWIKKQLQSTSQSQTWTKKKIMSLFGGLLTVWSTTAFWIPVKPLHLRNMLSKLMSCLEICITYSQHWSGERARFFSTTMPDHMSHSPRFKSSMWSFGSFTWSLANQLPLLKASWQLFVEKMFLQPAGCKLLSKSLLNLEAQDFMVQE